MYEFEFIKPSTVGEAVAVVSEDGEAKYLAGGQTLLPTMKQRLASPSKLVSLSAIQDMKGVSRVREELVIGGGTTHAIVAREAKDAFPALASLAGRIGDPAVRNRGTIGGSLANNDPAACYPSAVLACDATIITNGREIAAADFFQGLFTTALEESEIITAIRFPVPEAANYLKFVQPASRFALVGVFVAKFASRVGVAITGASEDGVFRWTEAEELLAESFNPAAVEELVVSPDPMIGDVFGSKDFRAYLIPVLAARAVQTIQSCQVS
ncbi:MAG: xanthine dehydrogenase family protein subunit M [Mesorhizobium sp.]|nr:MAG: xanthine dehydrogenase family protein subunit M [Mesorhizobium sp.]